MEDNGIDDFNDPEDYNSIVISQNGESTDAITLANEAEREKELITSFEARLLELVDPEIEYTEAQSKIAEIQAMMLPQLFRETFSKYLMWIDLP